MIVVAPLQPQLRRCSYLLCCCRVSLQPQLVSPFRREILLIFVTFYENSTGFGVIQIIVRFVLCCCVVVEFHSSHSRDFNSSSRLLQLQATVFVSFRMADAAALQAQINAAVVAALAAQAAVPAPVAHVAVKLPEFWVKDPKMWFSQAEAQFRRSRITAQTTMYDYVLMKLPEDVVMSVRALVSAIEADPVKQE